MLYLVCVKAITTNRKEKNFHFKEKKEKNIHFSIDMVNIGSYNTTINKRNRYTNEGGKGNEKENNF